MTTPTTQITARAPEARGALGYRILAPCSERPTITRAAIVDTMMRLGQAESLECSIRYSKRAPGCMWAVVASRHQTIVIQFVPVIGRPGLMLRNRVEVTQ